MKAHAVGSRTSTITTCLGPSLKNLGRPVAEGGAASGGGGGYTYAWTPTTGLDDPTIANPNLHLTVNQSILYTLTVTDQFGCTAQDQVTVTPSTPAIAVNADAGEDAKICYGTMDMVNGSPVHPSLDVQWLIPELDRNIPGDHGTGALEVDDMLSKQTGVYTVTQRVLDKHTGCFDEDEMILEILEQWKYQGYEPSVGVAVEGEAVPLWDGTDNELLSGFNGGLTYNWEAGAPQPFNIMLNPNGVPARSGEFIPNTDHMSLYLQLTDEEGCQKKLLSKRYALLSMAPQVDISSEPSPPYVCHGEEICFTVKLTAAPLENNRSLLPPSVAADYQYYSDRSASNLSDLIWDAGVVNLILTDGINGIYEGEFCLIGENNGSNSYGDYYVDLVKISGNIDPSQHPSAAFEEFIHVITTGEYANNTTLQVCDPFTTGPSYIAHRHQINVQADANCDQYYVPEAAHSPYGQSHRTVLTGGREGSIVMTHLEVDEGAYYHALIDLCSNEEFQSNDPKLSRVSAEEIRSKSSEDNQLIQISKRVEEPTLTADIQAGLNAFPNPFSGEIQIHYTLNWSTPNTISLKLLNVAGMPIADLLSNQSVEGGNYQMRYNGNHLPPGVYFCELKTEYQRIVVKIVKANY